MSEFTGLDGDPLAPLVGPFPHRAFLEVWRRHQPDGDLRIISSTKSVLPLVVTGEAASIAGEARLTDYHSPLGTDVADLGERLLDAAPRLSLDSLPAEACEPLHATLERAGATVSRTDDEPCMILDLPDAEDWEVILDAKQRHEVRRKRRRFVRKQGIPGISDDRAALGAFVDLHRGAGGDKSEFMTHGIAAFFEDLLGLEGSRLHVLRGRGRRILAAAFGFEEPNAHYLYNSAFDREAADVSPGLVLIDRLIARSAAEGRKRFDFLKGTEAYKERMGASVRPLYRLEVVR